MREGLVFEDGQYNTPIIGSKSENGFPESAFYVRNDEFGIDSALWGERKPFKEIFRDPRAANLVDAIVRHQFHHLDTRQLSLPERFETRSGSGRMNRLTTLVESAWLVANVGGTFEQIAQVMLSDINVTVGSHRLGDHLEGDYSTQSTRDGDISDYIQRSGLLDYLVTRGVADTNGILAGSPVNIFSLANPNFPRRKDIVECPRPYSNADRDPFTLYEALLLVDKKLVHEAIRSIVRAEIPTERGVEERLAYTDIDAARLTFIASVRHATEHWGDPGHHLVEETVSAADKHRLSSLWPYAPIDYVRTSESEWFESGQNDDFARRMYAVAAGLAQTIRNATWDVQNGYRIYVGPGNPEIPGISFRKLARPVTRPHIKVVRDTRYDTGGRITVVTPAHKRRQPIDPLVINKTGMLHLSQIYPDLTEYASRQEKWLGSYAITAQLAWDEIGPLQKGLAAVNREWAPQHGKSEPMLRVPMGKETLTKQISGARKTVIAASRVPLK